MLNYRKDIDGLRALAVLPVILYHAGIPLFTGGFIGVDIFFVISGFLITSILLKDFSENKFSLARFYERRCRRILPALTAIVIFCLIIGYFLLMSIGFRALTKSVLWLSFFSSNIFFRSEFGYFDAEANTKPLLHTWSLSVEEQFYVFFPIMLFLGFKYAKKHIGKIFLILALLSLIASYFGLKHDPAGAFYYIHYRAWELALGSILALTLSSSCDDIYLPELSKKYREILAAIGLFCILIPVFIYTQKTAFPSLAALPPCLGAFLLIWTNAKNENNNITYVGKFLSLRPVVEIGLLSYSLYLWHWPLLVFGKLYKGEDLSKLESILILLLSFIFSWLSLHFVEKPFREKILLPTQRQILSCSLVALVFTGSLGLAFSQRNSFIYKIKKTSALLEDPEPIEAEERNSKYWEIIKGGVMAFSIGDLKKEGMLIIGDSFTNHWINGLEDLNRKNDIAIHIQATASCPSLIDTTTRACEGKFKAPCKQRNTSLEEIIKKTKVKHVVLASSWRAYYNNEKDLASDGDTILFNGKYLTSFEEEGKVIAKQLEKTIELFRKNNVKVWIMLPPPDYPYNVPLKLAQLVRTHKPLNNSFISEKEASERRKFVFNLLKSVASKYKNTEVVLLDPFDYFCKDGVCITVEDNHSLYVDDGHLSYHGSIYGNKIFQPIVDELKDLN